MQSVSAVIVAARGVLYKSDKHRDTNFTDIFSSLALQSSRLGCIPSEMLAKKCSLEPLYSGVYLDRQCKDSRHSLLL